MIDVDLDKLIPGNRYRFDYPNYHDPSLTVKAFAIYARKECIKGEPWLWFFFPDEEHWFVDSKIIATEGTFLPFKLNELLAIEPVHE